MVSPTIIENLEYLLKELSSITILGEFSNENHLLELGTRGDNFFVRLDGAGLYSGSDAERAISLFYAKVASIYVDEQRGVDPGFTTLREILLSRNQHIQDMISRLGNNNLAKSLQLLSFSEIPVTESQIYKQILTGLHLLETVNYKKSETATEQCHLCQFFQTGGYCTKLHVPVGEEMVCDLFLSLPNAAEGEKFAETTKQPFELGEIKKGDPPPPLSAEEQKKQFGSLNPPETSAIDVDSPRPNNATHGSSSIDGREYLAKAEDIRLSAKALIIRGDDEILILKDSGPHGWYDLPGGHIKNNETIEDGLRREVFEETGLLAINIEQLFARQISLGSPPTPRPVVFFSANSYGKVKLSLEHTDSVWVPYAYITQYNLGVFLPIILDFINSHDSQTLKKNGHEMEVTDLGQPYYDDIANRQKEEGLTKHHEPSAYDMGQPDMEVDNIQVPRHHEKPPTSESLLAGTKPILKNAYSEAGGKEEREHPVIGPHDDTPDVESGSIQPLGSAARITLPDDLAEELGVTKQDSGGVGSAGEGVGTTGNAGVLTTSDVATATYGGGKKKALFDSDYNSSLQQKQHDMDVIGTNEGVGTNPDVNIEEGGKPSKKEVVRHQYVEDTAEEDYKRSANNPQLPPEQRPLGEGESNLWLSGERVGPNVRVIEDAKRSPGIFDEAQEQYTNLSADFLGGSLVKSADTFESMKDFLILSSDAFFKADSGRPLVVGGWGSYYIVDREGHRISLQGLKSALVQFLSRPEYANVNIFHSGIQVGKLLPQFVDDNGKLWKTEVTNEGLFVVVEFRTDLEVARRAMAEVLKGNLRGFSLSGNTIEKMVMCEHGNCWEEVKSLSMYEVTLCQIPMNQKSYITNIISMPSQSSCPECFENRSNEYDSSLRHR